VVRLGADIRLRCLGCGRRVLLERSVVERRLKQVIGRGGPAATAPPELHPSRFLAAEGHADAAGTADRPRQP